MTRRSAIGLAGLALLLLARIVSAHGGYQETTRDPAFGLKLRWPRFHVGESRP